MNFCLHPSFVSWQRKRAKIHHYYLANPCSSYFRLIFNTYRFQQWPTVSAGSIRPMVLEIFCTEMTQITRAEVSYHYVPFITHKKLQVYVRVLISFEAGI